MCCCCCYTGGYAAGAGREDEGQRRKDVDGSERLAINTKRTRQHVPGLDPLNGSVCIYRRGGG